MLLGLSFFAMIACIVKTFELRVLGTRDDFTFNSYSFIIWLTVENYVVIIAASIPTLRPLALKYCGWLAEKRRQSGEASNPPSYNSAGGSWAARPAPVRLHSSRREGKGKMELEPPYIHAKPEVAPPPLPNTIRKTISIYVRSNSEYDQIELSTLGMGGVQTHVSAGGRNLNTTAREDDWMSTSSSGRPRSRRSDRVDEFDLERQ